MQCSDLKKKLFWRAKKKDQQLIPPTPIDRFDKKGKRIRPTPGYYWKWTRENADKLVKAHQDSKDIPKSAWNRGTMQFSKEGKALLPKYNGFLSDTRSLAQ